jgi:20S proteasome subunit alpha 5
VEKIVEVDGHIGAAMSGLVADARILVDKARVEAQSHVFTYNQKIPVRSVAQTMSDVAMGFGRSSSNRDDDDMPSRPFGVALLLAGYDNLHQAQLYHVGPSGTYTEWKAKAIGSGEEGAQNALLEEYRPNMSLGEAMTLALKVLKQVMEEKINDSNVEVATITSGEGFRITDADVVAGIIATL